MWDIKEFLRNGCLGPVELGMDLEVVKELLPTADYQDEYDSTIFLFYGDVELSFPVFKEDLKHKLYYIQLKFSQPDGTCKQSDSYPFKNEVIKEGISKGDLRDFCSRNRITVQDGSSLDEDYEILVLGNKVECFFVKENIEDLGYKGLFKVIAS